MKSKKAPYFGMTGSQIGILGGLSIVAILSVCGLAWMILSMSSSSDPPAIQAPVVTQLPSPTSRKATLTPTLAPTIPVIATIVPPDGWIKFESEVADIWLPDTFVGGDMLKDKDKVVRQVAKLGREYEMVINGMKNPATPIVLWMIDKTQEKSRIITTVVVQHQVFSEATTLEQCVNDFLAKKSKVPTMNENRKLTLLGRETRRLTYQERVGAMDFTRLDYFIKDGQDFWAVSYSMGQSIYFERLPMIEKSMQTFNFLK